MIVTLKTVTYMLCLQKEERSIFNSSSYVEYLIHGSDTRIARDPIKPECQSRASESAGSLKLPDDADADATTLLALEEYYFLFERAMGSEFRARMLD